jgi:hemoglobin-like flavoprotein
VTPERKQIVERAWRLAEQHGDDLARVFYARLFAIDPTAAPLFSSTDMPAQRQKLIAMLRELLSALDDPKRLVPESAGLARRHITYGVTDAQYDSVGAALQYAFAETLGEAFTDDVRAAWSEAYTLLASIMRRAAALAHAED